MAYKPREVLGLSVLLFLGDAVFILSYVMSASVLHLEPSVQASSVVTAVSILILSLFGLFISRNDSDERPMPGGGFFVLAILVVFTTVACVTLMWQQQLQSASSLWITMIVVLLFLCVVSSVAAALFFRPCDWTIQLRIERKHQNGGRNANVPSVSGSLSLVTGARDGAEVVGPVTAQSPATSLPVIPTQPKCIYSTRIADEGPTAPQQQSYYQPLIFDKCDAGGSSTSSAAAAAATRQAGSPGCVAGRPSAVASQVPPVTDRPGVSTDDADVKTYENLK